MRAPENAKGAHVGVLLAFSDTTVLFAPLPVPHPVTRFLLLGACHCLPPCLPARISAAHTKPLKKAEQTEQERAIPKKPHRQTVRNTEG